MRSRMLIAASALLISGTASEVMATPPAQMSVQGRLTDAAGVPLPAGSKSFVFRIYDDSSSGTRIWPNAPAGEILSITTDSVGLWSAVIGGFHQISNAVFADAVRWLEIEIDGTKLPRTRLVTGPYAFRVASVDGAAGGNITSNVSIGTGHTNTGPFAFVVGESNTVSADNCSVTGGAGNLAGGNYAHVGGGSQNTANEAFTAISGGRGNGATATGATVGGGQFNSASGTHAIVAGGTGNIASGESSFAAGETDTASGAYATVAGGLSNSASADNCSVGGGFANRASGNYAAITGGSQNMASEAFASVVGGRGNAATAAGAIVGGGQFNSATGIHATVSGGTGNIASGEGSFVAGQNDTASGNYSAVSGGEFNHATASHTVVGGGLSNRASAAYATVSGGQSDSASNDYATVGGGYSNIASGPYSLVAGGYDNKASGYGATVGGGFVNSAEGTGSFAAGMYAHALHEKTFVWNGNSNSPVDFSSTGPWQFLVNAFGGVGINMNAPTEALHVAGNIRATACVIGTNIACPSDARFKQDVRTIDHALDAVEKLRGVYYDWKRSEFPDRQFPEGEQVGLIAQEVQKIVPQAVQEMGDGYLAVDYARLVPLLIEGMKEQQKRIEALEKKLERQTP